MSSGDFTGEADRDARIGQVLPTLAARGLQVRRQGSVEPSDDLADRRAETRDDRLKAILEINVAQVPDHTGEQEILDRRVEGQLQLPVDAGVECVDRIIQPLQPVGFIHRHVGHDDGWDIGIGVVDQPHDAGRAAAVDHRINETGSDDLPSQAMELDRLREFVLNLSRKILR